MREDAAYARMLCKDMNGNSVHAQMGTNYMFIYLCKDTNRNYI